MATDLASNGCNSVNGLAKKSTSEQALKFAKKLFIHGGNISNWNRTKRKTTPSSADEVCKVTNKFYQKYVKIHLLGILIHIAFPRFLRNINETAK